MTKKKTTPETLPEDIGALAHADEPWDATPPEPDFSDAVTNDVAGIGDNGPDDETIRMFARGLIAIAAEAEVLGAKRKSVRKRAKAAGITLGRLDAMISLMSLTPQEQREHFATERRYAEALRVSHLPPGAQIDLLTHATDTDVMMSDAYDRGFHAAVTGKGVPGVPPDDLHPSAHQHWMQGWSSGQAANAPGQLTEDDGGEDE